MPEFSSFTLNCEFSLYKSWEYIASTECKVQSAKKKKQKKKQEDTTNEECGNEQ